MAKKMGGGNIYTKPTTKKTRQCKSNLNKRGRKGGGPNGSTTSKSYKKRSRGQGK